MKKIILITLLLLVGISLGLPQPGYTSGRWYVPGAFVGGALLGAAIARPYAYPPPAAYVYPAPPVYAYPAPPVYGYYVSPYYGPGYYPGHRYHGYYSGRGYGHRW